MSVFLIYGLAACELPREVAHAQAGRQAEPNVVKDTMIRLLAHHAERNHQGLANVIPFPDVRSDQPEGPVVKAERLGGLLNFYHRHAA